MSLSDRIKVIRQSSFLSQEAFARELNVSFSSVNRWESGKSKPNLNAMKNIKEFCSTHEIDFSTVESEWLKSKTEGNK